MCLRKRVKFWANLGYIVRQMLLQIVKNKNQDYENISHPRPIANLHTKAR